jgi:hypothetical protein
MRCVQKLLALAGIALSLGFASGCCCWCQNRSAPYYSSPASSCYQPPVCSTANNDRLVPTPMPARPSDTITR